MEKHSFHVVVRMVSLAASLAAGGCMTYHKAAVASRNDFLAGDGAMAEERAKKLAASKKTKPLGCFELARMKMLKGDFAGSYALFAPQLEEIFDETAEGPVLKTSAVAGTALAATVSDDMSIPYAPAAYETVLALQYQAVNSLALGRGDDARVYMRRATAIQEQLKEEKRAQPVDKPEDAGESGSSAAAKAAGELEARLAAVASQVGSAYENAHAWYFAGYLMEADSDMDNAAIAYREAAAISPAAARFASSPKGEGADVLVVYEESLVDMMEPVKIPLVIGGTAWSIDFPVYRSAARKPARIAAETDSRLAAELAPVVNVQALAYRNLKDAVPGMVARNISRAAVKIAAQQAANHVHTGNSSTEFLLRFGVLAFNTVRTVSDEADTRSWITIPEHVHFARIKVKDGVFSLRNTANGRNVQIRLPPHSAGRFVVWVSDTGRSSAIEAIPLPAGPGQRSEGPTIL